ncbi:MAG: hypothetical protein JSS82_10715 [Bacteroidetes bacterium]|nr:hypothetical protein [Bacteroidota bacterium]
MHIRQIIGLAGLLFSINSEAQKTLPPQVDMVRRELSAMDNFSYEYTVKQSYPDGTNNILKGKVSSSNNIYKESSPQQTIFQTKSWYYKADHSSKTVYIINLDKVRDAAKRKISDQRMNILPDSLLNKYGNIRSNTEGKVVKIDITFGKDLLLKRIYLEYDMSKKLPKLYRIESDVLYDIDKKSFEESYAKQIMTATDFVTKGNEESVNISDYFDYKNGKIALKKYTHYKLIQHI